MGGGEPVQKARAASDEATQKAIKLAMAGQAIPKVLPVKPPLPVREAPALAEQEAKKAGASASELVRMGAGRLPALVNPELQRPAPSVPGAVPVSSPALLDADIRTLERTRNYSDIISPGNRQLMIYGLRASRQSLRRKEKGSAIDAGAIHTATSLMERLAKTDAALLAAVKTSGGEGQIKLASAYGDWRRRAKAAVSNLVNGVEGAADSANTLANFGQHLCEWRAKRQRILELIPRVERDVLGRESNRTLITGGLKAGSVALTRSADAVAAYLKSPSRKSMEAAANLIAEYNQKAGEALTYYGAAMDFQDARRRVIAKADKARATLGHYIRTTDECVRNGWMSGEEGRKVRRQLQLLRDNIRLDAVKSFRESLRTYRLEDAVQRQPGGLVRSAKYWDYMLSTERSIDRLFANPAVKGSGPRQRLARMGAMHAVAWEALLAKSVGEYYQKGYGLGAPESKEKAAERDRLRAGIQRLIADGRLIMEEEIKGLPKYVEDPEKPGGRLYMFDAREMARMKRAKGDALFYLNAVEEGLFKGRKTDPFSDMLSFSGLNSAADKTIAETVSARMEEHFSKETWWEKHSRFVGDVAVIGLGVLGCALSGGTASPIIAAAEAAYFAGTGAMDMYAEYAMTRKMPGFFAVAGTGLMAVLPASRAAREFITLRYTKALGKEMRLTSILRPTEAMAKARLGAFALGASGEAGRAVAVLGVTESVAGKYLMGSAAIGLMSDPSYENVLKNLVFFGMGSAHGITRGMAQRRLAKMIQANSPRPKGPPPRGGILRSEGEAASLKGEYEAPAPRAPGLAPAPAAAKVQVEPEYAKAAAKAETAERALRFIDKRAEARERADAVRRLPSDLRSRHSALKSAEEKFDAAIEASNSAKGRKAQREAGAAVSSARVERAAAEKAYDATLKKLASNSPAKPMWEIERDTLGAEYPAKLKRDIALVREEAGNAKILMDTAERRGDNSGYDDAAAAYSEAMARYKRLSANQAKLTEPAPAPKPAEAAPEPAEQKGPALPAGRGETVPLAQKKETLPLTKKKAPVPDYLKGFMEEYKCVQAEKAEAARLAREGPYMLTPAKQRKPIPLVRWTDRQVREAYEWTPGVSETFDFEVFRDARRAYEKGDRSITFAEHLREKVAPDATLTPKMVKPVPLVRWTDRQMQEAYTGMPGADNLGFTVFRDLRRAYEADNKGMTFPEYAGLALPEAAYSRFQKAGGTMEQGDAALKAWKDGYNAAKSENPASLAAAPTYVEAMDAYARLKLAHPKEVRMGFPQYLRDYFAAIKSMDEAPNFGNFIRKSAGLPAMAEGKWTEFQTWRAHAFFWNSMPGRERLYYTPKRFASIRGEYETMRAGISEAERPGFYSFAEFLFMKRVHDLNPLGMTFAQYLGVETRAEAQGAKVLPLRRSEQKAEAVPAQMAAVGGGEAVLPQQSAPKPVPRKGETNLPFARTTPLSAEEWLRMVAAGSPARAEIAKAAEGYLKDLQGRGIIDAPDLNFIRVKIALERAVPKMEATRRAQLGREFEGAKADGKTSAASLTEFLLEKAVKARQRQVSEAGRTVIEPSDYARQGIKVEEEPGSGPKTGKWQPGEQSKAPGSLQQKRVTGPPEAAFSGAETGKRARKRPPPLPLRVSPEQILEVRDAGRQSADTGRRGQEPRIPSALKPAGSEVDTGGRGAAGAAQGPRLGALVGPNAAREQEALAALDPALAEAYRNGGRAEVFRLYNIDIATPEAQRRIMEMPFNAREQLQLNLTMGARKAVYGKLGMGLAPLGAEQQHQLGMTDLLAHGRLFDIMVHGGFRGRAAAFLKDSTISDNGVKASVRRMDGATGSYMVTFRTSEGNRSVFLKETSMVPDVFAMKMLRKAGIIVPEIRVENFTSPSGAETTFGLMSNITEAPGVERGMSLHGLEWGRDPQLAAEIIPQLGGKFGRSMGFAMEISRQMGRQDLHGGNLFALRMNDGSVKAGCIDLDFVATYVDLVNTFVIYRSYVADAVSSLSIISGKSHAEIRDMLKPAFMAGVNDAIKLGRKPEFRKFVLFSIKEHDGKTVGWGRSEHETDPRFAIPPTTLNLVNGAIRPLKQTGPDAGRFVLDAEAAQQAYIQAASEDAPAFWNTTLDQVPRALNVSEFHTSIRY